MDQQTETAPVTAPGPGYKNRIALQAGLAAMLVIVIASSFTGGYFLHQVISGGIPAAGPTPTPPPGLPVPTISIQPTINFVPGKRYFEDGFYIMIKDAKDTVLVGSVGRQEETGNQFKQHTRISRIGGDGNIRQLADSSTTGTGITADKLITGWQTSIDPSRVLKETNRMDFTLEGTKYKADTGEVANEIAIRSLPGYTKFFSAGKGKVEVNGTEYPALIVYYRIYSQNYNDIFVYQDHLGITTDLAVLWDNQDRLILMDATEVSKTNTDYLPHRIAFLDDLQGNVKRSFEMKVLRGNGVPPASYAIVFGDPITARLDLISLSSLNKGAQAYDWFLSQVSGTADFTGEKIPVKGIIEYINDQ